MRDADVRRIPIDVKQPGMYVVEAVLPPHRAYTIVIVSDVGLITKAAPGQVLAYTADRTTGKPLTGCDIRVLDPAEDRGHRASPAPTASSTRASTIRVSDDVISVATCGEQTTATDPGSWYLHDPTRELVGYVYTDKPIYRPGHTVHVKAFLRWRSHGALLPFDGKGRRAPRLGHHRQGDLPPASAGRCLRRDHWRHPAVDRRRARLLQHRCRQRRRDGQRQLRGAGIPQAGVRGPRHARRTVRRAGAARPAWRSTPATTSGSRWPTPASPGSRIVSPTTRRCDGATKSRMRAAGTGGVRIRRLQGTARLDANGKAEIAGAAGARRARQRLHAAHRSARHRRQQPRSERQGGGPRDLWRLPDRLERRTTTCSDLAPRRR